MTHRLTLYDTFRRQKVDFEPIDATNVRMYVCGPTVYDRAHIGNARPIIVFDVLYRLLRHVYGAEHVTYARNITDVEDKINTRAAELGIAISELTETTTQQLHDDIAELCVLPPDIEPRATDHIEEMKAMCEILHDKGHAYVAENHILFQVSSDTQYGQLSNRSLDEMIAGSRVEVAPYKKDATDFVLWKPSLNGEPAWPSPCGIEQPGRPGWHIECSAMAGKHLGETIDIHGGGIDLVFPHHENELAQSRCAHGTGALANVWMHNGFLQVEGEKMSKSLGNFITIREVVDETPGEAARLAMLMTHYRQPINWTAKAVTEARRTLDHWYELTRDVDRDESVSADEAVSEEVLTALTDDLNTPRAIAALHGMRTRAAAGDSHSAVQLKASANLMGLLEQDPLVWRSWRPANADIDEALVNRLVAERLQARANKDWSRSDAIRDELAELGVQLKDAKDPKTGDVTTTWELKR